MEEVKLIQKTNFSSTITKKSLIKMHFLHKKRRAAKENGDLKKK